MKRIFEMVLVFACGALFSGCACVKPYFIDRAHDLTDVAHVEVNAMSLGAAVNVGPAILGWNEISGPDGGQRYMLGLGGYRWIRADGQYSGVIYPLSKVGHDESRSETGYSSVHPTWGSVGFDVGLVVGLGARVDIVELIDFILKCDSKVAQTSCCLYCSGACCYCCSCSSYCS